MKFGLMDRVRLSIADVSLVMLYAQVAATREKRRFSVTEAVRWWWRLQRGNVSERISLIFEMVAGKKP